ncbi:MAG: flagellar hook-basal body complex protein [Desulfovibrionaceae bacterium]|nr:flagellar hook-basal body complex protein [Desulfovibrionaceae bacterium]
MRSSLYIGATGMKSLSEGMHVTTNNLANCSTIGFKSQMALYSDLIYEEQANPGEWNFAQANSCVAVGQHGMGVRIEEIATNFTQGALESTNSMTDMAISGKGYFIVQDEYGKNFYTRAGDFNVDTEGTLRNPNGLALLGQRQTNVNLKRLDQTENQGENVNQNAAPSGVLEPIKIDKFYGLDPKATSQITIEDTNVLPSSDVAQDSENPWFSLLGNYNATRGQALTSNEYSHSQSTTVYDKKGDTHQVNIYYDGAKDSTSGYSVEFLVAEETSEASAAGQGLLMSGVLQFDSSGQLINMAAYTPSEEGSKELKDWTQASLSNDGYPELNLNGQKIAMNFGVSSQTNKMTGNSTAAQVGTNQSNLATLSSATTSKTAITGYPSASFQGSISQNGYGAGELSNYEVATNGKIYGNFSNGEHLEMWQINLATFVSDDGLMRKGDNLFAATSEAGAITIGAPGSGNLGTVQPYYIEQYNVYIDNKMVKMIITQRGFQSNSKVVTTSDELLKTAINLKQR